MSGSPLVIYSSPSVIYSCYLLGALMTGLLPKADTQLDFLRSVAPCVGLKSVDVTEVLVKSRSKFDAKINIASIIIYPGDINVIAEKVELPDHKSIQGRYSCLLCH